ncbi:MAG: outer membrane lipoprotein chaperone LolA [Rhodoferax sp.]|nr:outer membrane lipoprotein chaperone LolA [Rhodoferax sp.]
MKQSALRVAIFVIANYAVMARAGGLESLENFLKATRSGRAEFTQQVSAPARQGQAARTRNSSGRFEFVRPERFRFSYRKPFEQTLVADGRTLWLHDPDLNQVTARPQAQALGATPAALIATASDLRALQADFVLTEEPAQDGQQWVLATPRQADGAVQRVRIGFRGAELSTLEILDSFGQRSLLSFSQFQANPALDPGLFQFRPPPGADLIRP